VATLGGLDILVNNDGVVVVKPIADLTLEDFDRIVAINVRGLFVASQAAQRHMGEGGRIINIGSVNSDYIPFAGGALYAMTKAAVAGLTKGLARDLGPRGITVTNVQPGPVDTDMNPASGAFADQARSLMALPRYARAEEIAAFVAYLAGPEAGFITGVGLRIDGGYAT
jgi:3-oxoacyl-[acyl-carrier protein] reductase